MTIDLIDQVPHSSHPTASPFEKLPGDVSHRDSISREFVDVRVMSFTELFEKANFPLGIDAYQRPYVWGADKAEQLLADLEEFTTKGISGIDYYMGTILLHWNREKGHLFVIDGQQRLTTLCILHKALHPALPPNCQLSYRNPESWRNIKRNASRFTGASVSLPSADIFDRIRFTVITVDSEDLAFTFFDTQNNRGVPLGATDLLKAYHLRAISGQDTASLALQKNCAARWEGLQNIQPLLGTGSDFAPSLFQYFLWRGRRWTGRAVTGRSSHDDLIQEFQSGAVQPDPKNHISSDTVPLYSSRGNRRAAALTLIPRDGYRLKGEDIQLSANPADLPFAIRQPVSAGVGFFLYCEKYAALARQLLNPEHEDPEVRAFQLFHQAVMEPVSVYLRELFLLACVMFVDQFGYRQLFRFALWLDYALGAIRIEKAYIFEAAPLNFLKNGSQNLLDVIASAFRPEEVIAYLTALPDPADIYAKRDVQGNGVQGRYKQSVLAYYGKPDSLKGRHTWIDAKVKLEGLA